MLRKKRVEAETFCEQAEKLLPVRCRTEDIFRVRRTDFTFVKNHSGTSS
jgi:hypothetical protein